MSGYEDKLTAEQRIRLEAINQANGRLGPYLGRPHISSHPDSGPVDELLIAAGRIEQWITSGGAS